MKLNRLATIVFFVIGITLSRGTFFAYTPINGGDVSVDDDYVEELPTNEDEPEFDIIMTPALDYLNISTFDISACEDYYGMCESTLNYSGSDKLFTLYTDSTCSQKYLEVVTNKSGVIKYVKEFTGAKVSSKIVYQSKSGTNRAYVIYNYKYDQITKTETIGYKKFGNLTVAYVSGINKYSGGDLVTKEYYYEPTSSSGAVRLKERSTYSKKNITSKKQYTNRGYLLKNYIYKSGKLKTVTTYGSNRKVWSQYGYGSNGKWTSRTLYHSNGKIKQKQKRYSNGKIISTTNYNKYGKVIKK